MLPHIVTVEVSGVDEEAGGQWSPAACCVLTNLSTDKIVGPSPPRRSGIDAGQFDSALTSAILAAAVLVAVLFVILAAILATPAALDCLPLALADRDLR